MSDDLLYNNLKSNVENADYNYKNASSDSEVKTAIYELLIAEHKLADYLKSKEKTL